MKLHRYVEQQRLHITTKDRHSYISSSWVICPWLILSISVLLLFRHYISHKITFGAPSSGGVLCSACGAFIFLSFPMFHKFIWTYLHFQCKSLNEPLHLRCRSYLHEQIDLSHTYIHAIWAGKRQRHPIKLLVFLGLCDVERVSPWC